MLLFSPNCDRRAQLVFNVNSSQIRIKTLLQKMPISMISTDLAFYNPSLFWFDLLLELSFLLPFFCLLLQHPLLQEGIKCITTRSFFFFLLYHFTRKYFMPRSKNYQWFQCLPLAILSNWNAAQLALSINLITLISSSDAFRLVSEPGRAWSLSVWTQEEIVL